MKDYIISFIMIIVGSAVTIWISPFIVTWLTSLF